MTIQKYSSYHQRIVANCQVFINTRTLFKLFRSLCSKYISSSQVIVTQVIQAEVQLRNWLLGLNFYLACFKQKLNNVSIRKQVIRYSLFSRNRNNKINFYLKAYFLLLQKEHPRMELKIVSKYMQLLDWMENVNFECHQLFRYTFEIILNIFYFQLMSKKQASFLNNWAEVGDPNSGIVRESSTGREGERRIVALDPLFDPKNQQFIYNYRRETKSPFVNAYGSELLALEKPPKTASKDKKEVKDPYNHLAVITERIPFRLVDAPQLTYPQSLYVLDRSLEGFETAYEKCGPMRVNDRLIGFNNQGQCKVWINQDFANNHPSYPRRRLMTTRPDSNQYLAGSKNSLRTSIDEADMVQDVVDTVENYSEEGRFPEPFATRIHQRDLSFAEARRLLHENITEHRIPVPNRVDLITNRVRGFRKVTTTQQHHVQQVQQVQQVVTPVTQTQTTTVVQKQPVHGYRFNYLPVDQPFHPNIFASRVGEHGVYNGHAY